MTTRPLLVAVLFALVAAGAFAAAATPPTIESPGSGTIEVAPDYVEFWIHINAPGKTVAEATDIAQAFEGALRKEMENRKIVPAAVEFSNLAIPKASSLVACRSAKLRFNAVPFKSNDDGAKQYAKLCDDILALAAGVPGAAADGPVLGVENTKPVEQAAIALATEKAYPPAESIATAMKTQITGIQNASVISLVWNQDPASKAQQPDIRRLTCTAKVKITYLFPAPLGG